MKIHRFTSPDGKTLAWVNLESVLYVTPAEGGKVSLHGALVSIEVDASQFEEAIKPPRESKDYGPLISRLIQAVDRLTVRIPSSIRLHM